MSTIPLRTATGRAADSGGPVRPVRPASQAATGGPPPRRRRLTQSEKTATILAWYTTLPEPELAQLMNDVDRCVRDVSPAFASQATRATHGETVTSIVEKAFVAFLGSLDDPDAASATIGPTFARVGKQMALDGLEIETMQRTLVEASTLIVHRLEHLIETHPLPAPLAIHLVSMVSSYLGALRDFVDRGYRSGGGASSGSRRDRAEIFHLLATGPSPVAIQGFVDRSGLTVPQRVRAVCLGGTHEPVMELDALDGVAYLPASGAISDLFLDADATRDVTDGAGGDAADLLTRASAALPPSARIVVGPEVPAARARESLGVARAARRHLDEGRLPRSAVFRCDDHLVELMLLSDHVSIDALVTRRLAPLRELAAKDREEYATVLLALLATGKSVRQLAGDLHYHQQTLQARVNRLKGLYGEDLDEPGARLEIMLALRHLLSTAGRSAP